MFDDPYMCAQALASATFTEPRMPVFSNVTGAAVRTPPSLPLPPIPPFAMPSSRSSWLCPEAHRTSQAAGAVLTAYLG